MAAIKSLIPKIGNVSIFRGARYPCTKRWRWYSTGSTESTGTAAGASDGEYEENIRNQILTAALPFVLTHGWTKTAISQGAETLGYPGITHGMFPNGGADLVHYFYQNCNNQLTVHMENICSDPTHKKEPLVFIEEAIEKRLRMIVPYLDKWPQAMGIMALPPHVPLALANLLTLVDDICHHAGDQSVDFNWYSRRLAVCAVYKMTELCLVQDRSQDHQETWRFLRRRLEEASQVQGVLGGVLQGGGEAGAVAREAVLATFTTARNILRLNTHRTR